MSPLTGSSLETQALCDMDLASPRSLLLPNCDTTLNGGSLGSWVDEDRSELRVGM